MTYRDEDPERQHEDRPETESEHPTDIERTTPPPGMREDPDWFSSIGPEDEDPEVIAENLEEYGLNLMDEDDFESDPVAPSDMPNWTDEATYGGDRPLMPDFPDAPLEDHLRIIDEEAVIHETDPANEYELAPGDDMLQEVDDPDELDEIRKLDSLDEEQRI